MKKLKTVLFFLAIVALINTSLVVAVPIFYDSRPLNSTFTFGKDTDIFSVNVSDPNLDQTSVVHHIRVYQVGTNLTNTSSSCASIGSGNWYCSNSVSSFGSLGGDGNTFVFYFDAKNTSGSSNTSGNYFVTIDRSAPQISPSFSNNSYLSGNASLAFKIIDSYSGVNSSSAQFFYGNSTFNSTPQSFVNPYIVNWDTRSLMNNSTYFLYVNVSDNIGNVNTTRFVETVDNFVPTVSIILPTTNSTITGITYFQITANDSFAGLNLNSSTYILDGNSYSVTCTGNNVSATCTTPLVNTSSFTDGFKTINFTITSNSGIIGWNTTTFYIVNNPPSISFIYPSYGSFVRSTLPIVATISDPGSGLNLTEFRWENSTVGSWTIMSCSGANCSGSLDTTTLADGNYSIKINATGNSRLSNLQSISITADNTRPNIIVNKPDINQVVSGVFLANLTVTDNIGLPNSSTTYSFNNISGTMNCTQVNNNSQILSCLGNINSTLSIDGPAIIDFTTADLAGNQFTTVVNVTFRNGITSISGNTVSTTTAFSAGSCGNGVCNSNENYCTCPKDCSPPTCKDYQLVSCKSGIPTCVNKTGCGNGICEPSENCSTCPADCGTCKGNETGGLQNLVVGNMTWIFLGIAVVVGGVLVYFFFSKPKGVYPGFKPKEN